LTAFIEMGEKSVGAIIVFMEIIFILLILRSYLISQMYLTVRVIAMMAITDPSDYGQRDRNCLAWFCSLCQDLVYWRGWYMSV
jgi:hypothetical protein